MKSSKTHIHDLIVIGGGSAGFNAARVASGLGKNVAIVDGAPDLGGLCILRGCMPSKTLLHAADVLHHARHGGKLGIRAPGASIDMRALHRWKKKVIGEFSDYRVQAMQSGRYALHRSHARFIDSHTLKLDNGDSLRGQKILIATGSRVSVPPIPGLADTPHWTSDDVLDLDYVPESVIVLGGGIVACELAQFLNRIGSKVTLIQRSPHLLREHSPEAADVVAQAFRDEGIRLHTGTRILSVSGENGRQVRVVFEHPHLNKTHTCRARHLFNALGREPATDGLNLDAAGVALDERGRIRVNRWQQTTQPHIYAGGDVCGPHEIVHLAVAQGELATRHAFGARLPSGKPLKPIDESLLLGVVFTDPALATIGWQEHLLRKRGQPFVAASYPFNDHGKSIVMDATYGHVKVIADPVRGRLLGAEIVGRDAGELIHAFSGPLAMRATVHDLLRAPWYHPTLAEIITYPLEEIADQLKS
ncbi:NAD(P)/FAD-dependent oxidoreductase [Opitutaceae bacterium TAV4]|nr:NAD(P)/FAD-dependent oxidoreductase [Opitutaceae bacterium TAV4]RRK02294.1 NAD(P)/FAD-dependent oxidoreductase [Opitutaceae bacterium TAV3]